MNNTMAVSQSVIPIPDPGIALGNALSGGYIVHPPEAGPVSTNNDDNRTILLSRKNQYESIFINGDAISLAPASREDEKRSESTWGADLLIQRRIIVIVNPRP